MLVVRDSRVVKMRETDVGESGWHFRHKPKSRATLKEIEKMIRGGASGWEMDPGCSSHSWPNDICFTKSQERWENNFEDEGGGIGGESQSLPKHPRSEATGDKIK